MNLNWAGVLPLLRGVDPSDWNGTLAKLLAGECFLVLATAGEEVALAVIVTIGCHGATSGRTCFIDVLGVVPHVDVDKAAVAALDVVNLLAAAAGCTVIVGETPNEQVAALARRIGFKAAPVQLLWRSVNG